MRIGVIGLGKTGRPLFDILNECYGDVVGLDAGDEFDGTVDVLNICIPYCDEFVGIVEDYAEKYKPGLIINHATVPVGTTDRIKNAVHSPILGDHTNMKESLRRFPKWIGGKKAGVAGEILGLAGIRCRTVREAKETELLKLFCLAKYGKDIAFAQYQKDVFNKYGFDYSHIIEWDMSYTMNARPDKQRPVLTPPGECISGSCVVPGARMLFIDHPNPQLEEILKYE
jgi:UDP-N-acetyl-D-mannosaminuronate dehydrogenase